jgi:hypothetical protein
VTFKGSNSLGDHVSGTAVLSLLNGAFERDLKRGQA